MTATHPHPHVHPHPHAGYRPQASAVLDIGGEVGALLVHAPADLAGREIQLYTPAGEILTHTEVHAREVPGAVVHAGLFPAVPAGDYLVDAGGPRPMAVRVVGGSVTEAGG